MANRLAVQAAGDDPRQGLLAHATFARTAAGAVKHIWPLISRGRSHLAIIIYPSACFAPELCRVAWFSRTREGLHLAQTCENQLRVSPSRARVVKTPSEPSPRSPLRCLRLGRQSMSPRGYAGGTGAAPGSGGTLQEHLASLTAAASVDPAVPFPPPQQQQPPLGSAGGFGPVPPRPPRPATDAQSEVGAVAGPPWHTCYGLSGHR